VRWTSKTNTSPAPRPAPLENQNEFFPAAPHSVGGAVLRYLLSHLLDNTRVSPARESSHLNVIFAMCVQKMGQQIAQNSTAEQNEAQLEKMF